MGPVILLCDTDIKRKIRRSPPSICCLICPLRVVIKCFYCFGVEVNGVGNADGKRSTGTRIKASVSRKSMGSWQCWCLHVGTQCQSTQSRFVVTPKLWHIYVRHLPPISSLNMTFSHLFPFQNMSLFQTLRNNFWSSSQSTSLPFVAHFLAMRLETTNVFLPWS